MRLFCLIHLKADDYSSSAPSEGSSAALDLREPLHADGVDLSDPVPEGCPFDLILDLAILENAFQGDQLPLLKSLGELREISPGKTRCHSVQVSRSPVSLLYGTVPELVTAKRSRAPSLCSTSGSWAPARWRPCSMGGLVMRRGRSGQPLQRTARHSQLCSSCSCCRHDWHAPGTLQHLRGKACARPQLEYW
jgi:hypothetical protein